jgi:dCTP deaminase
MILNDNEIAKMCVGVEHSMITPFVNRKVSAIGCRPIVSYGLSSFGYDVTLGNTFKAYTSSYSVHQPHSMWNLIVDPLDFNEEDLLESFVVDDEFTVIPPHGYFLAHTNETIRMPPDVNAICLTKSTYARVGVFLNTTPLNAGWVGVITLEIANLTNRPVKLYINQGICLLQFFRGNMPDIVHSDNKYQYQKFITLPR